MMCLRVGNTPEDFELELDDDFQEENVKNEETGNNQTWNIGILSNFIRQNDNNQKANSGGKRKISEKSTKEPFRDVLTNLNQPSQPLTVSKKEKKDCGKLLFSIKIAKYLFCPNHHIGVIITIILYDEDS